MRAFISWSGSVSKSIGETLHHYLALAFPSVQFWMTSEDLSPGTEWFAALGDALADARLAVVCLTPQNLTSNWILFESGAVSHALGRNAVIPYLYQLSPSDLAGPLSQFQGIRCDRDGTRDLFRAVNAAAGDARRPDSTIDELLDIYWPRMSERIDAIPPAATPPPPQRSERAILEEILALLRSGPLEEILALLRHRQSPVLTIDRVSDRPWRADDFADLSDARIEQFFTNELWPQAKDRAHRSWANVPAKDPFLNARLEAVEIAQAAVDRLGLREHWDKWFPRRPVP